MNMVFVKDGSLKNEPYTTSKIIAECGGQEHESVVRLIGSYQKELRGLGKLHSVKEEYPDLKSEKSKRGRPSKIFCFNEEQATFLITLMKNTPQVVMFKKNLVKEFFTMRQELQRRAIERETELNYRKELTTKIQSLLGNEQHKYIAFTQMLYKTVFGKSVNELREYYDADKKKSPKDFMPAEDLQRLKVAEQKAVTLLELGYDYYQVKEKLNELINGTIAI